MVRGRPTALPPHRHQKGFKKCPLGIHHQQPRHDNLRKSYLESDFDELWNHVCQQVLVLDATGGDYTMIFAACTMVYFIAVGVIHLLTPRLAKVEV